MDERASSRAIDVSIVVCMVCHTCAHSWESGGQLGPSPRPAASRTKRPYHTYKWQEWQGSVGRGYCEEGDCVRKGGL